MRGMNVRPGEYRGDCLATETETIEAHLFCDPPTTSPTCSARPAERCGPGRGSRRNRSMVCSVMEQQGRSTNSSPMSVIRDLGPSISIGATRSIADFRLRPAVQEGAPPPPSGTPSTTSDVLVAGESGGGRTTRGRAAAPPPPAAPSAAVVLDQVVVGGEDIGDDAFLLPSFGHSHLQPMQNISV